MLMMAQVLYEELGPAAYLFALVVLVCVVLLVLSACGIYLG